MFRRKQDVDKHVSSILMKKRDEKERNGMGYQIARLYADIKEFSVAKRYLLGFLSVRENVPSAFQLMGEIYEGLAQKEAAISNYKRALDLGGFVSTNRHLVRRICELYTEIGTDIPRMKYWLEQLEKIDPKSDTIFKLKAMIVEADAANGANTDGEMEDVIASELVKHPTDLKLRIKLLQLYLDTDRLEEAYEVGVSCDLTTAFVDALPWFHCLSSVFKRQRESNTELMHDTGFTQHYLHILRNLVYLSLPSKDLSQCSQALYRFDQQLKHAVTLATSSEAWSAMLREMKGQLFFLAALVLLKRAQTGAVLWKDVRQLSGACLLASKSLEPIDAQAAWFVSSPSTHSKFYTWWQRQSYDRLSQVGHMLQQLSLKKRWEDVCEWTRKVRKDVMTATGQQRLFELLYQPKDLRADGALSFLFQAAELVAIGGNSGEGEPFSDQSLLGVDRVAYQVHLGDLNHLVWLCLQRYSSDMAAQPNYHFQVMENIQYSVRNLENTGAESLCQLDLLVFLVATVRCAASSVSEMVLHYADRSCRPNLLPVCLAKPFVTTEQQEWWEAAYRFCTNSVRDDFSRLRRVLVKGLEVVRLVDSHGLSAQMMVHIARSLDAKVKSYRLSEHGCRCSAQELAQLESRAAFYWEKAKAALNKLQRNQHTPMPKKRMFKEAGDLDPSSTAVKGWLEEAIFALAYHAMNLGNTEEAIKGFEKLRTPWAKFHSAKIYKALSEQEADRDGESEDSIIKCKALVEKARDSLLDTIDRLEGDKGHELNIQIYRELDELEVTLHGLEIEERKPNIVSPSEAFHTPVKSPSEMQRSYNGNGGTPRESLSGIHLAHSTPRQSSGAGLQHATNGSRMQADFMEDEHNVSSSTDHRLDISGHQINRPRPSPERLDAQLRSVSFSQSSMFKMVLERNDELIVINSKLMEELRDNNTQLKNALLGNQSLMADLKELMGENRDTMREIRNEVGALKTSVAQQATAAAAPQPQVPIAPTPPLYLPPHMAGVAPPPRGPGFPSFPPPAYPHAPPGYMMAPPGPRPTVTMGGPGYRPSGLPGSQPPNVGKYRSPSDEEDDDLDPDDLTSAEEAAALFAECCDDPSYSQYFTPEAPMMPDWSARAGMDGTAPAGATLNLGVAGPGPQPSGATGPLPPRMSMPSPGYFASALRGQALYAQNTPPPTQVRPPPLGPGFFSSPLTSGQGPAGVVAPPAGAQPSLLAALTGQSGTPASSSFLLPQPGVITDTSSLSPGVSPSAGSSVSLTPALSGLKSLFQSKGVLEPNKLSGDITILVDTNSRRATILMMGETKDIVFHHDIQGLVVETLQLTSTPNSLTWTATKIDPRGEREKVCLSLDTPALATQLKEAIQKATTMIQPKNVGQGVAASVSGPALPQVSFTTPSLPPVASTVTTDGTAAKPTFGGFTFSQTPVVAQTIDPVPEKPAVSTTPSTAADAKPFANVFLTPSAPAATKTPSASSKAQPGSPTKSGQADDDHAEEFEPNVHFQPVIALPDLVEKTTGEENETSLFVERCRMYRFDSETKQWKERGIGELKILSSKDKVKFRVIMRRDQILKLCANHCLGADMKLTAMPASDRAWCYSAMDYSEEEMKLEQLAVKFKDTAKAGAFKDVFNDCCQKLKAEESNPPATKLDSPKKETPVGEGKSQPQPQASLSELFKPKAGSWECDGCLVRNGADVIKCPACGTPKPGATIPATVSGISFGGAAAPPATSSGFTFGGKLTTQAPSTTASIGSSSGFRFGTSAASTTSNATAGNTGGFVFGQPASTVAPAQSSGFIFGKPAVTTTTTTAGATPAGGFVFGKPASSTSGAAPQSSGFKFNLTPAAAPSTATGGEFKFGSSSAVASTTSTSTTPAAAASGFSFKLPASVSATSSTAATTAAMSTIKPAQFFTSPTTTTNTNTSSSNSSSSSGLLAKLLTTNDPPAQSVATKPAGTFNFSMTPKKTTTPAIPQGGGFQFSLTPQKPAAVTLSPNKVPGSPEVDEQGLYITKEGDDSHIHFEPVVALPDKVEVKTGEEEEDILFEGRGKMYRFVSGEWKEKGLGPVKILQHRETRKTRILMRRDQILKICCNHGIDSSLNLQPMNRSEGKAWVWYAIDFSDDEAGKMEQLALRFKTAEIASDFKAVFDKCRAASSIPSPSHTAAGGQPRGNVAAAKKELFSPAEPKQEVGDNEGEDDDVIFVKEEKASPRIAAAAVGDDNDIIFVKEEKATPEQVAQARMYHLPDNFYLYENRPPCPGCLGCTDGEIIPPAKVITSALKSSQDTNKPIQSPAITSGTTPRPVFGPGASMMPTFGETAASTSSNLPDFSQLAPDTSTTTPTTSDFVFGSGASVDFSSLAAASGGKSGDFAWKKADSGQFSFAGAGQKLFGAGSGGADHDGDTSTDQVAQSEDIHFEPVIPLPDLVEVKTGEEDWKALFCQRSKLYKFDKKLSQWKERGIGEIKLMQHNTQVMFRVLQRREQVLKVSCNHLISVDMELKAMSTSETAWCWTAQDFTDSDPSIEQFAVKFKTKEVAQEFKTIFEKCQETLRLHGGPQEGAPNSQAQSGAGSIAGSTNREETDDAEDEDYEEDDEDEEDDDEDDDDDDYDEDDIVYEKRVTLSSYENGQWKNLGTGSLVVSYNDDISGNCVRFTTDSGLKLCSHVITRELGVTINNQQRSCEWQPLDYATDEPVRRYFAAAFSSLPAATEFKDVFDKGRKLAVDADLSEKLPSEIEVPEVFSSGEPSRK